MLCGFRLVNISNFTFIASLLQEDQHVLVYFLNCFTLFIVKTYATNDAFIINSSEIPLSDKPSGLVIETRNPSATLVCTKYRK